MKVKFSLILIFLFFIFLSFSTLAQSSNVLVVEITDTIDQGTVEILKESIQQARKENSEAIILLLDTPGGDLQKTFEIADLINESEVPFVGYVYPSGSVAWSAGTFILMSAHVAAMADYTVIGSCQPVEITVEGTKYITESKIINALVGWIQTRAEMYGRNQTIAAKFITENLDLNATLAKEYGVVEHVSPSIDHLLQDINGTSVPTKEGTVILDTMGAKQIVYSSSLKIQIMKFFSNPILTSLLLMLGIFALIFGIWIWICYTGFKHNLYNYRMPTAYYRNICNTGIWSNRYWWNYHTIVRRDISNTKLFYYRMGDLYGLDK
jgi:membrane-bound serine protease (ClpP class)